MPSFGCTGFAGFEVARCYTIGPVIVTPAGHSCEIITSAAICRGSAGFDLPFLLDAEMSNIID